MGSMTHGLMDHIRKSAISIIDIKVIWCGVIIADIDVHPPVAVYIRNTRAQTIRKGRTDNAYGGGYLGEFSIVVAEELRASWISGFHDLGGGGFIQYRKGLGVVV